MTHAGGPRRWELPGNETTREPDYLARREFLRRMGLAGAGLVLGGAALGSGGGAAAAALATRPGAATAPPVVGQWAGASRKFREFADRAPGVGDPAGSRAGTPSRLCIEGLVEHPREIELDELLRRMPIEERTYRHRCVSGWSAVLPWTGFPLASLVAWARPLSSAHYLRVVSFLDPVAAPNQARASWYPWPYTEAYRLDEAVHDLAFVATGVYGRALSLEHGSPLRIAMPWKYGYKNAKAIVRLEFTERMPATFWNSIAPARCDALGNVNAHARGADGAPARELVLGTGELRPTLPFNGYGEFVSGLYRA